MESVRISGWQFFLLVFNFTVGTAIFLSLGGLIIAGGQDAWIIPLWTGSSAVLIACLWLMLSRGNPGLSIIQICTKVAGNKIGGLFALLYISFFIEIASWVTRNLGTFMKTVLMPRTPLSVFHLMFLAVACYATIKGIESIARVTEFLTPIVVLLLIVICLFSLAEWKWERFEPMFTMNLVKTIKETRSFLGFPYLEVISLMMIFPYVKSRVKSALLLGIAMATVLLSGTLFVIIGVLGVTRASHFIYPLFILVQEVRIAEFIERIETTIVIIWLVWIFIKLCISYYCAVAGICQLFRLKDRTWVAISLILLISGFAITFSDNIVQTFTWGKKYNFQYNSLFGILLPLLLLFLTWIQKRRKQDEETPA
ncbi:GerAB/ArcD/ProY family transporter [Paenibacillus thiaminolyticus]|uniref:GerAB/ArcD/ProY family transporter n=1 Tax=Paenibacillus thiaminolyticus TaxID=49283 RepID=UPI002542EB8C|nr:endospore germination permease [Paenibacillus thiaminolyticus]WII35176.1 endospore germination permease [Paenibacillus thiaminolyticus]